MKKILSIVFLFLTLLADIQAQEKEFYNQKNTAIVFDIDGVILKRTLSISSLLWHYKGELLKALFDTELIKKIAKLYHMTAPVGAYITLFENKRPNLVPFAQSLATTRTLKQDTVCIINALLEHGYSLHIGTNETANEFALHQQRFPIFSRFSTYTFADYSRFPEVIQKPNPLYYQRMKERIHAFNKHLTNFIFIDDRQDNVQAARDTGYSGITFANADALQATLVEMDIIEPLCATNAEIPSLLY